MLIPVEEAAELYIAHTVAALQAEGVRFDGLQVALDAGHGAAGATSAEALRRLGAQVHLINVDSDGMDINVNCGSTCLEPLRELVATTGAHVGIAHDGDADRVMFVDAAGNELDGDVALAVCALDMKARGILAGNTVVSTVMCNLGFVRAMEAAGIQVVQAQVGDRFVLEAMCQGGFVLGGEQSGHIIFLEQNSTGDGLASALQFLAACGRHGGTVAQAAAVMTRFPQELINVRVAHKEALPTNAVIVQAIEQARAELGTRGRILVRPSGTEPVVRVMVEAEDATLATQVAEALAAVVSRELS